MKIRRMSKGCFSRVHRQRGMTLMEMLIAMVISLVVSLAMVTLMANTLSTGTDTIGMARVGSELRTALQIMTRDVRRANYHGNFSKCFGNWECRDTLDDGNGDTKAYIKAITIGTSVSAGDCFYYWFDRDSDGDVTDDDDAGAFRRIEAGGVGVLQMTTTRNTTPSCTTGNYWVDITDRQVVDVETFTVVNTDSFTDTVIAGTVDQNVQKVAVTLTGKLIRESIDSDDLGNTGLEIRRTVRDTIRVRNDFYTATPASP